MVAKTKTGPTPRKGAKVLAQKSTKKELQIVKPSPQVEKQLSEEDAIIKAAEQYHRQLSEKKVRNSAEKQGADKQTKTNTAFENKEFVKKNGERTGVGSSFVQNYKTTEVQSTGSERDLSVNIFTGNPGNYQTEGDTLNFWSFTPLPVDSVSTPTIVTELPGKPYGFEGKPIKTEGQDWTFFLVLIGWTIFASLQFGFSKYIVQIFQGIFNFSATARLYRERGYNNNFGIFRLNVIFYLFLPFSIYLIARDNGATSGFSGIEFYLIVFLVVNAYFLLKIFLYKILGSIFSQRETTGELIFNMMLYHNVLGLILLPIVTIHSLVPGFGIFSLFIVPGLIGIFYLMSIIRSIYFAFREGISIFYLILYLCTLEILPILLVVKLALGA